MRTIAEARKRMAAIEASVRRSLIRPYYDGVHRVAILASHVIQYQDPFFRLLGREPGIDLTVLFCSPADAQVYRDADMQTTLRWDIEMLTGYEHVFLRNFGFGDGYTRLVNPGIVPKILRGNFD